MLVARWVPVPDATVDAALAALDAVRCRRSASPPHGDRDDRRPTSTRRWSTPSPAIGWRRTTGARRCRAAATRRSRRPAPSCGRSPTPTRRSAAAASPTPTSSPRWRRGFERHERRLRGEPVVRAARPARRARRPLRRLGGPPRARRRASTPAAGARPRTCGTPRRSPSRSPAGPTTWPRLADAVTDARPHARRLRRVGGRAGHRARAGRPRARRRGGRAVPRAGAGRAGPARHRARRPRAPRAGRVSVRGRATPTAGGDHGTALRPRGRRRLAPRRRRRRRPGRAVRRRAGTGRARAGATLLHSGRRWVRIDPAALRRARTPARGPRPRPRRVDAVTLLRLAGEGELDAATPCTDERRADVDRRAAGRPARRAARRGARAGDVRRRAAPVPAPRPGWMQFLDRLGLGGCLADDMGLGKTATTLAHLLDRPGPHLVVCPLSVVHNWEAEAARFAPSLRVVVHHGAERRPAQRARRRRPRRHHLRAAAPRHRAPRRHRVGHGRARRGAGDQEPGHPGGQGGPRRCAPGRSWRSPARRSRTASPSCGRSSTPSTRACSAAASGSATASPCRSSATATARPRPGCAASPSRSCCAAPRPTGRWSPTCPTRSSRSPAPGSPASRPCCTSTSSTSCSPTPRPRAGMRRRGLVLAALTRLKQICNHPAHALGDGSRLAGRSGKLARFDELVDELLDVGERALVFTQFREMGELLHAPPRRAPPARPSRSCTAASAGRVATAMVAEFQAGDRPAAAARVAEGRRHRAQPHRRQPGDPLRPVVEPGRRGPGHRPGVAHRPAPHGQRPQARVRGHGRGAHRRADRPEAGARRRRRRQRRGVAHRAVDRRAARAGAPGRHRS